MERSKRILVIDDDPNNVELIVSALAREDFPHETIVAHDGADALDYLCGRGTHAGREGLPPPPGGAGLEEAAGSGGPSRQQRQKTPPPDSPFCIQKQPTPSPPQLQTPHAVLTACAPPRV